MNLSEHYGRLYDDSLEKIRLGQYSLDSLIDSPVDTRRGVTLLLRPSPSVAARIQSFLQVLRDGDPAQYYYPAEDLHVTVLSLITCHEDFRLEQIQVPRYVELIQEALQGIDSFEIHFQGVTLSPGCVLIAGFPEDETLGRVRERLRFCFKNSPLLQSLDQRYVLVTAHSTVVRFRKPFRNLDAFLRTLAQYRSFDFGTFRVASLELVYNDWYQRQRFTRTLASFALKNV